MPKRTLYVKEADEPIWERAARLAQGDEDSLSKLVAEALREFVAKKEAQREGEDLTGKPMKEVVLEIFGTLNQGVRRTVRFTGTLLYEGKNRDFGEISWYSHQLYLTKSRKLVWFKKHEEPARGATVDIFDYFEEFEAKDDLKNLFGTHFSEIAALMGEDFTLEID